MIIVFHIYRQNKEIILAKHFFPTKQAQNRLPAGSAILNVDRFNIMRSRRRRQGSRKSCKLHDSTGNEAQLDIVLREFPSTRVVAEEVSKAALVIEPYNAFGNV